MSHRSWVQSPQGVCFLRNAAACAGSFAIWTTPTAILDSRCDTCLKTHGLLHRRHDRVSASLAVCVPIHKKQNLFTVPGRRLKKSATASVPVPPPSSSAHPLTTTTLAKGRCCGRQPTWGGIQLSLVEATQTDTNRQTTFTKQ